MVRKQTILTAAHRLVDAHCPRPFTVVSVTGKERVINPVGTVLNKRMTTWLVDALNMEDTIRAIRFD